MRRVKESGQFTSLHLAVDGNNPRDETSSLNSSYCKLRMASVLASVIFRVSSFPLCGPRRSWIYI